MKKTLLILLSAVVVCSPLASAEESAWYGSLNLGVAFPEGELTHEGAKEISAPTYGLDNGGVVGIGAGYAFGNALRLEGELRARRFDAGGSAYGAGGRFGGPSSVDGTATSTTLMANLAYDFVLKSTKLRPYLKGGLGVAWNQAEADRFNTGAFAGRRKFPEGTDTQFAWSLGAGAAYPINDRLSLTTEYQYIDLGSAETDADIHGHRMRYDDLGSHEVTLGLRYTF